MTVRTLYLPERVAQARLDFALRHRRLTRRRRVFGDCARERDAYARIICATRRLQRQKVNDNNGRLIVEVNVISELQRDLHLTLTFRGREAYL